MSDAEQETGQDCGHAKCDGEPWESPNGTMIATKTCHHCMIIAQEKNLKTKQQGLDELADMVLGSVARGVAVVDYARTQHYIIEDEAKEVAKLRALVKKVEQRVEQQAATKDSLVQCLYTERYKSWRVFNQRYPWLANMIGGMYDDLMSCFAANAVGKSVLGEDD